MGRAVLFLALAGLLACRPLEVVAGPGEAVDCVCAHNRDMACVVVKTDPATPKVVYQGKTYWFCSEDCKAAFLKDPAKYCAKPD